MKKKGGGIKKGFTLIELLVVISILGILAAIVLFSVRTFINNGKDAAIKHNMANLLTQSNAYILDENLGDGYYDGFCTHSGTISFLNEINVLSNPYSATCNCDTGSSCPASPHATLWCVSVRLNKKSGSSTNYFVFCMDSSGIKREADYEHNTSNMLRCLNGVCTGGLN